MSNLEKPKTLEQGGKEGWNRFYWVNDEYMKQHCSVENLEILIELVSRIIPNKRLGPRLNITEIATALNKYILGGGDE